MSKTFSYNGKISSFPLQSTSSKIPKRLSTLYGPPVQPKFGYAAKTLDEWPGVSISGTTVICNSEAFFTTAFISSSV